MKKIISCVLIMTLLCVVGCYNTFEQLTGEGDSRTAESISGTEINTDLYLEKNITCYDNITDQYGLEGDDLKMFKLLVDRSMMTNENSIKMFLEDYDSSAEKVQLALVDNMKCLFGEK